MNHEKGQGGSHVTHKIRGSNINGMRRNIFDQVCNDICEFLFRIFTGMILCLQAGIEMQKYGQEALVGNLVIASLTREMSPFIGAVVLIASVGSAIAAEIATMKVSEEIDALAQSFNRLAKELGATTLEVAQGSVEW